MSINKLTALQIKQIKTPEKEKLYSDGGGLYLRVLPSGAKSFYIIITHNNTTHKETIGEPSTMSLEQARQITAHKKVLIKGLKNGASTLKLDFKSMFDEYLAFRSPTWSKRYKERAITYNEQYFKLFWALGVSEISRADILLALDPLIKSHQRESLKKAKSYLSGFFNWALHKELCQNIPTNNISLKFLFGDYEPEHFAHLDTLDETMELKKRICNYFGHYQVRMCALLQLYTATRPSEARKAVWGEFDLENLA